MNSAPLRSRSHTFRAVPLEQQSEAAPSDARFLGRSRCSSSYSSCSGGIRLQRRLPVLHMVEGFSLLPESLGLLPLALTTSTSSFRLVPHCQRPVDLSGSMVGFGFGGGLEAGGTYFLEVMTVYFMVRFPSQLDQIVAVIRLLFWLILIATIFAIPEAIMGVRFIHEFAHAMTGNLPFQRRTAPWHAEGRFIFRASDPLRTVLRGAL